MIPAYNRGILCAPVFAHEVPQCHFECNPLCGHGNRFVTTEPKFVYLKSPGVKFMNYFTDLKNPLLKSFGSYKVEMGKMMTFYHFYLHKQMSQLLFGKFLLKSYI